MKIKMLVALPLSLLLSTHAWAESSEISVSTSFKNYMEIMESEFFEQGWLPDYLPKSAENIVADYAPKSKKVTATFDFDKGDTQSIKDNCSTVSETETSIIYSCANLDNDISIELDKEGHGVYSRTPLTQG
jgi:hypothetical protein